MSLAFHYAAATPESLVLFAKQVLHSTGLPCVGLNGTVVLFPHSEQMTRVSVRYCATPPPCPCLLALHCLQCFGSLTNPFSEKNCCSPAENTNCAPQPTHKTSRSTKAIILPPNPSRFREGSTGDSSPSVKTHCVSHIVSFYGWNRCPVPDIRWLIFCSQQMQESPSRGASSFSGMGQRVRLYEFTATLSSRSLRWQCPTDREVPFTIPNGVFAGRPLPSVKKSQSKRVARVVTPVTYCSYCEMRTSPSFTGCPV